VSAAWVGPLYLETSALAKLLVAETESDALNAALDGAEDVILSDLSLSELASVLGRRCREGALTAAQTRLLFREAEKVAASCRRAELTPPIHRHAERLLLSSAAPLRTLDALHLALALDSEAATLVSYDRRLREAGTAHGLASAPEHLS
jgi:predicted nucleic acid-binding protein